MGFSIIGLDGIERESSEVFAACGAGHGLNTTAGYIVRSTFFERGLRAHEDDSLYEGAGSYCAALGRAHAIRADNRAAGIAGYAVIDWLYTCGCRGQA